jgi:hypothetical protein
MPVERDRSPLIEHTYASVTEDLTLLHKVRPDGMLIRNVAIE